MDRRLTLAVAVVLVLALAGCGSPGGSAPEGAAMESGPDTASMSGAGGNGNGAGAEDGASAESGGDDAEVSTQGRKLVRTGEIELRVNDTAAAGSSVRQLAAERGGFVAASSRQTHETHNETYRTERVVVRVPSDEFEASMAELEGLGEVESATTDTEDVTEQLVDIEARLENLRAERDRLRRLFESANETDDVLAVQRELSDVQEEIERLEARRQSLERDVALSTITVELAEERPEPRDDPDTEAWYDAGVTAAFLASVEGVATALRALVVGAAYVAPYAVVFGTPLAGGATVVWYRRG